MIRLWSINRWLRWAGFLVIVQSDGRSPDDPDRYPTRIGVKFMGWPPGKRWAEYCDRTKGLDAIPRAPDDLAPQETTP